MKVLWVKADKLLPVENGGNIRTYHVLRYLASRHELTFYSYYGRKTDSDYERELQRATARRGSRVRRQEGAFGSGGARTMLCTWARRRRIAKWTSDAIEVTGRAPSVVEHLRQSAAVVIPLRMIMLLHDGDLRRRHERAAAETAARYDWPAIGERFSEALQSVVEMHSRASGAVLVSRA